MTPAQLWQQRSDASKRGKYECFVRNGRRWAVVGVDRSPFRFRKAMPPSQEEIAIANRVYPQEK